MASVEGLGRTANYPTAAAQHLGEESASVAVDNGFADGMGLVENLLQTHEEGHPGTEIEGCYGIEVVRS